LVVFEAFDAAFDSFDGLANPLLDEVCGQSCLFAELVVETTFGFGFRGDVVPVVSVPAPLARGVGTVFELLDSLLKVYIRTFRCIELDYGGSTVPHCAFTYIFKVT
jgi:hypothetical protein